VQAGLDDVVQADLAVREPDPYASHPSLRERLAALGQPAEASAPPPAVEPASNLLRLPAELEQHLLSGRFGDEITTFAAADWHEAGDVHLRRAKETVQRFGGGLPADATVGDAAHLAQDVPARRERLRAELDEADRDAPDDALDDLALEVLASRVVVAAHAAGCEVEALPGDPVTVCRGERRLAVWRALAQIVAGEEEPGSWREQSAALGIAGASLAVAEASLSA